MGMYRVEGLSQAEFHRDRCSGGGGGNTIRHLHDEGITSSLLSLLMTPKW